MFDRSSSQFLALVFASSCVLACSSKSDAPTGQPPADTASFILTTPDITVPAGQERYVCFSKTFDETVAVDRFEFTQTPTVHHVFLSRSLAPEPEGLSECNVIFKQTWLPMFVTGNGSTALEYPPGAASVMRAGQQVVFQLHLLNSTTTEAHTSATIAMRKTTLANPDPVAIYAFGTQKITLLPHATADVVAECKPVEDVDAFATLAHLHRLGTALHFSVEADDGTMQEVVNRDPYSFDNQFIEAKPIRAPAGKKTVVTCSYDNTTNRTVGFGESSNDEMCYLVGYIRGKEGAFGCQSLASDVDAGTPNDAGPPNACMPTENAAGVGAPCTKGGNECKTGLSCSLDQSQTPDGGVGFCLRIGGCTTTADCGGGDATCCAPAEGGGVIKICIPESCRPSTCAVAN